MAKVDWGNVDWRKRNVVLSRELGVTVNSVYKARIRFKKRRADKRGEPTLLELERRGKRRDQGYRTLGNVWRLKKRGLKNVEVARIMGIDAGYVGEVLKRGRSIMSEATI